LQLPKTLRLNKNGIDAWKEYKAIERVGLYIPGGTAPLVSTLLMLAIPAVIAKCREIIVVTPPNKNGEINPAIIYAAKLCGINKIFAVGGAQAIAALAYGTETIPKVVKIFGPGNKYVTEAKLQVAQDPCGAALDMPAGPSEVLVIADDRANAQLVAADLLSQAEHDVDSKVILITTSQSLANQVDEALTAQLKNLQRQKIITKSLENAAIIIVDCLDEAFAISNIFAPEHLILQIDNPRNYLNFVQNAGSVFIGRWSAEALGDYASGPNHVLPTYGYAKSYSGLGVESFMKSITFQEVSKEGLLALAPTVETLAQLEGLDAHKIAVNLRRKMIEENL
jgi:histidinol dehydrogenase